MEHLIQPNSTVAWHTLRIGLALVFLWFGVMQWIAPLTFEAYLPEFVLALPVAPEFIIRANSIFEIVLSALLLMGVWVRPIAAILALHLAAITLTLGWTQQGIRDFGLTMATAALALGYTPKAR